MPSDTKTFYLQMTVVGETRKKREKVATRNESVTPVHFRIQNGKI